MHRGEVGGSVLQLEMDMKRVMEPFTALNLKVSYHMLPSPDMQLLSHLRCFHSGTQLSEGVEKMPH